MDRALRPGQTVPVIKENTLREGSTARENSHGLMEALTVDSFTRTILKAPESINGPMAECTMESGKTIRWRAMVFSHGQTAEDTRDNM